ncbi:MAG: hypothetical protein ACFFC7_20130 [Candidatus Hermodarchaeota archaeon]
MIDIEKIQEKFEEIFSRHPDFKEIKLDYGWDPEEPLEVPDIEIICKRGSLYFQYVDNGKPQCWIAKQPANTRKGRKFLAYYKNLFPEILMWASECEYWVHNLLAYSYEIFFVLNIEDEWFFAIFPLRCLPNKNVNPF